VTGRGPDPETVARLLRQQLEMGGGPLFLQSLSREQALSTVAGFRGSHGAASADAKGSGAAEAEPLPRGRRAGSTGTALAMLPESYVQLREAALACTRCRLAETRTQVVFSDGAVDARLVVVGEAPGANEDATGLPFVGAAGQFLDLLLATVDLSRKDTVYICNVLKCRPPGNRNPLPDEIEACTPWLKRQLELVSPRALLAVGTFAAQALTGKQQTLGRLRGTVHAYQGLPVVVTYHPAALLRNAGWTRAFWDDLQLLREVLDGA
jgi:uracil-DNA glycosylase family 4